MQLMITKPILDGHSKPWLVPEAIKYLERLLFFSDSAKILETGAGGSTLWFAHLAEYVVSLEHSKKWFNAVDRALKAGKIGNVNLIFDPDYPKRGIPVPEKEVYDFILIDGRGRVRSILTVHPALKPGGYLILDNSDRKRYVPAIKFLTNRGWERIDFIYKWKTTFWKKSMKGE